MISWRRFRFYCNSEIIFTCNILLTASLKGCDHEVTVAPNTIEGNSPYHTPVSRAYACLMIVTRRPEFVSRPMVNYLDDSSYT